MKVADTDREDAIEFALVSADWLMRASVAGGWASRPADSSWPPETWRSYRARPRALAHRAFCAVSTVGLGDGWAHHSWLTAAAMLREGWMPQ